MASESKRLGSNAKGDFFVDSSCINCSACRSIASSSFGESGKQSRIYHQPESDEEIKRALMALLSCPTSSIGAMAKHNFSEAQSSFPDKIDGPVYHCGFHSKKSFGATSYLLKRERGNVLIDSPRFVKSLVKALDDMGGVKYMFLTHKDDVADHQKFRDHFNLERIIHVDEITSELENVEIKIEGGDLATIDNDLIIVPVPGHTKGSACLLYQENYLFTGDHLYQNPNRDFPTAFVKHCWHSWEAQIESMARVAELKFQWILPGHGARVRYPLDVMPGKMRECVGWMKSVKR